MGLFLSNTIISVYIRACDLMSAQELLDEMLGKNLIMWAYLISRYNKNGMPKEACGFFEKMVCIGF